MGAGGIFLVIVLLAVSIGLGVLLVRQWFEKRQLSDELFKAQTALNDRTNKLEALSEAFTTRKMVEGNLGEKLRDLTQYIEEVQTAYATELDANTALVNSVKAELNAPKASKPPQLSEDNEADKLTADTDKEKNDEAEASETETARTETAEPKPVEPEKLDASESKVETDSDIGEDKAETPSDAPSAPFRLEAKAPTDTHIDKKVI